MGKRVLAWLLVAAMLVCLLPAYTFADEADHTDHNFCGDAACTEHESVQWQPWEKTDSLPTSGSWYLTGDVTVVVGSDTTAPVTLTDATQLQLCLNGKTVTLTTQGKRLFRLSGGAKVSVCDCQAATDAAGVYTAGMLTAAEGIEGPSVGACIYLADKGTEFNLYDGVIKGFTAAGTSYGGGIYAQNQAAVNLYGGMLCENAASSGAGVAVYSKAVLTQGKDAVICHNRATGGGGGIFANGGIATLSGRITANTAAGSGGSGVFLSAGATVTFLDATVTDNHNEGAFSAAKAGVYTPNVNSKIIVSGATVIDRNTVGSENREVNVMLQDDNARLTVQELTDGANISVSTQKKTYTDGAFLTLLSQSDWQLGWLVYDNSSKTVDYRDGVFTLVEEAEHMHCLCGGAAQHTHTTAGFSPWEKTDSLPTAGSWYLTGDVTVTVATNVHSGVLQLCLNGYDITLAENNKRIFDLRSGGQLALTDCTAKWENGAYTSGKLTAGEGITGTWGGVGVYLSDAGTQFTMYGGTITGLTASGDKAYGGGFYAQTNAQIHIYDGLIENNRAVSTESNSKMAYGGGIYAGNAKLFLYGGQICGNRAVATDSQGGGIYAANGATLTVTGGRICHNEAKNGGGIAALKVTATLSDATISENINTASGGSGIYLGGSSVARLTDMTVINNRTNKADNGYCGGVYVPNSSNRLILSGKTVIDGNTANGVFAADVLLQNDTAKLELNELEAGSRLSIRTIKDFEVASFLTVTADGSQSAWDDSWVKYSNTDQQIDYKDSQFELVTVVDHFHCACGLGDSAQCAHRELGFMPWKSTGALPTASGCYYLTGDVTVTTMAIPADGAQIYLCLNGYSITVAQQGQRAYRLSGGTKLTVTDCAAAPGRITAAEGITTSGLGGAFYLNGTGTQLDLHRITVAGLTGKADQAYGGAIYGQSGATVNLFSAKLQNNCVISTGENMKEAYGGAVAVNGGTVNLYGGEVTGNRVESVGRFYGGGIFMGSNSQINIYGGTVANNQADRAGGVYAFRSQVYMEGGLVSDNAANDTAGGVIVDGGTMKMTGGVIRDNTAAHGGGIFVQSGSTLELSGGEITGNRATQNGGGIYVMPKGAMQMTGGTISGNRCGGTGGGVVTFDAESVFSGGTVSANAAQKEGGGIYVSGGKATLNGTGVRDNSSVNSGGGVVARAKAVLQMNAGTISGNRSKHGGGLCIMSNSHYILAGGTVSGNAAELNGGGVYISDTAFFTLYGGSVRNNQAGQNGGGVFTNKATVSAYGGKIAENNATKEGGGVYCSGGTLKLEKLEVCGNHSDSSGGGIVARAFCKFDMTGGNIYANSAVNGGGLLVMSGTELTMSQGEVYENSALDGGGGIYISQEAAFTMHGGTVHSNTVEITGGGLFLNSPSVITGGVIRDNRTLGRENYNGTPSGGGICIGRLAGTVQISGGRIENNQSVGDAGAVNGSWGTVLQISGGEFIGNTAAVDGGAIDIYDRLEITGGSFVGNSAGRYGGVVNIQGVATLSVSNATMQDNSAVTGGGAVYIPQGGRAVITDATFTGNSCGRNGAAIYTEGKTMLSSCHMTGNNAPNGTLYIGNQVFDGESYMGGSTTISGDMQIFGNEGKIPDVYITGFAAVVIEAALAESAKLGTALENGLLTNTLFGSYDYEKTSEAYVVTAGERSLTEPEAAATEPAETQSADTVPVETQPETNNGNGVMLAGIAIFVALLAAAGAVIIVKNKKAAK